MKRYIESYQRILESLIKLKYSSISSIDPEILNHLNFDARAIYMAVVIAARQGYVCNSLKDLSVFFKNKLQNDNFFSTVIDNTSKEINEVFSGVSIGIYEGNIGELYESLLNIETTGLTTTDAKGYRNNLGSYYTPSVMADFIVKKSIDLYLEHGCSILDAQIFDPSCGAGVFLTSALKYISSLFEENSSILKKVALNVHGCDVDPIAIELAVIQILDLIKDYHLYPRIKKNFYHANFLIYGDSQNVSRLNICQKGFIYNAGLTFTPYDNKKYDIILGNPPWEKIRFEEKAFYSQFSNKLSKLSFKFQTEEFIQNTNQFFDSYASVYRSEVENVKSSIKNNGKFKQSNRGELNTCTLFTDAAFDLLTSNGILGMVVKSSMITSPINKLFFKKINRHIIYCYDFINSAHLFDIDSRERFSLLGLSQSRADSFPLCMNAKSLDDIHSSINMTCDQLKILNPETEMLPNVSSENELKLLNRIYNEFPLLSQSFSQLKYGRLVHFTSHAAFLSKTLDESHIPVYEGKFFNIFDGAYSGFNDVPFENRYKSKASTVKLSEEQKNSGIIPLSRFYIDIQKWITISKNYHAEYMLAWHSLTSATNSRTCVSTILPFQPASQSVQFLVAEKNDDLLYLAGIFNSIVFDYIVKCKLNGIDLTQTIVKQVPVPSIKSAKAKEIVIHDRRSNVYEIVQQVVRKLLKKDSRLHGLWNKDCPSFAFLPNTRKELMFLLDIAVAYLYSITGEELEIILTRFDRYYTDVECKMILNEYMELLN